MAEETETRSVGRPAGSKEASLRRWRDFVNEYIIDFNGAAAVERCPGYKTKGKNAGIQAAKMLTFPEVQEMLREAIDARKARLELSQDLIVRELLRVGVSDMRNYLKWGPDGLQVKPSEQLTEDEARALNSVEMIEQYDNHGEVRSRKFKFATHNKNTALDSLMKHIGGYREDNKFIVEDNRQDQLETVLDILRQTRNRISDSGDES